VATRIDEIADRIYRLSTFLPGVGGPQGFTFNQFLIQADAPLLFHCGQRAVFPEVSAAAARLVDLATIRWVTYSHVEADECGSLNAWLAAAPQATAAHGAMGCALWLDDTAPRPPRRLAHGERIDLGGKTVRYLDTPHVPHELDAGLLYEETTGTLFCSDLLSHVGETVALTESDILGPAIATDAFFPFSPLTPKTGPTLRKLAELAPRTLAVMHGASYRGDCADLLRRLGGYYDDKLRKALSAQGT
jgi:flavorubredoxin